MSGKSKINIHKNMTDTELDEEMSKYVAYYRYYQRLIAMKIISKEKSIQPASNILNILIKQYIDGQKLVKKKD